MIRLNTSNPPIAWKRVKLGECVDYLKGFPFKSEKYQDSGVRVIRVSDLGRDSIHDKNMIFINSSEADKYYKWSLEENDLICTTVGSKPPQYDSLVGRVVKIGKSNVGNLLNQNNVLLRAKSYKDISQLYIFNQLSIKKYVTFIEGIIRGNANQGSITLEDLFQYSFMLPPLSEQKRIVAVLVTWDEYLEKLDQKIELKKNIKKSLMRQLLTGDMRIAGYVDDWKRQKLDKISKMSSGGTPKSTVSVYYGGDIPWVSIADMTSNGQYLYKTVKSLTEAGLSDSAARIYPKGTILYAMYASIGECSIAGVPMASSQAILGIIPDENHLDPLFLFYYLSFIKDRIKLQGQQGTQSNLNAGMVRDFDVLLPSLVEQKEIVEILVAADEELTYLKRKRSVVTSQKRYLVDNLITGKIRTPEDLKILTKEIQYA